MKLVIFAGGVGTRLWPLSRENSPKQFDRIFNGKSTLELAISRVAPYFGVENIFIQTGTKYQELIKKQLGEVPLKNLIIEPARRDLGAAVCFSAVELNKQGYTGTMALLWADHLMERTDEFIIALKTANKLIANDADRFVFLAERPRFANNNLGWINVGSKLGNINGNDYYEFVGWKYKPLTGECDRMYKSGEYYWNPGYFVTSVSFLLNQYENLAPGILKDVRTGNYHQAEITHFDKAIIEKIDSNRAVVLKTNMGWSDPGTLYALKEALEESAKSNVVKGNVFELNSSDCLMYNLEDNKLMTAIGLKSMVIVNTKDALIVAPRDEVVHISKLIQSMKEKGLNKYL
jgi:mannose-1-phosphate guanylyltransferase